MKISEQTVLATLGTFVFVAQSALGREEFSSVSPVDVISADEISSSGLITVNDLIGALPSMHH
ncbi:MAG: hypothetical protein ABJQ29_08455 [Luteolibacter sp.]